MNNMTRKQMKRRDQALYARLMESYHADRVSIFVDFDRLNHPRSPVFSPWENVAPLMVLLLAAMVVMLWVHMLVGTAALVLAVFTFMFLVRPIIAQRLYRRTMDAATLNVHNWKLLWRKGGLVIALNYNNKTRCVSPEGDWRAFVSRYLPEIEMEGYEGYSEFNQATKAEDESSKPNTSTAKDQAGTTAGAGQAPADEGLSF